MQQPPPQQPKQQQPSLLPDFQAGVTATLRSWSALRAAVESGWGGGTRESQQKAEVLRQNIFDVLNGNPKATSQNLDVYDLADNLAIYLEEEFSVTLEDNSEQQVAETIFKLYEECIINGNPTLARQMVANAEGAVALNSQFPVQVQTTGDNDNDDDDDDEDGDAMMTGNSGALDKQQHATPSLTVAMQQETPIPAAMIPAEYLQQPLFGKAPPQRNKVPSGPVRQLGEAVPEEEPAVEMDEDGFATVKPKGRRRR